MYTRAVETIDDDIWTELEALGGVRGDDAVTICPSHSSRPRHREALLVSTLVLALLVHATPGWAAKWVRLRAPHFVLVGDVREGQLREVAQRLEGFREVLRRALPNVTVAMPVPTTVIVFGSDASFKPFKPVVNGRPMENIGGYFQAGEDANYIAISLDQGERAYPIIFHEYAHALLSATLASVPTWLNEGIAELYSTFSQADGGRTALIGAPPIHHVSELRAQSLGSIVDLLSVDAKSPTYTDAARRVSFYARSWLLAHYVFLGNPTRRAQLPRYLDLVERDVPVGDAFRLAFECEPKVIEGELREYLNGFSLNAVRISFDDRIGLATALRSEPVSEYEARAYTAELLARQERVDEAQAQITAALAASPDLPRALAAMGRLYIRSGRTGEGLPLLERAAALDPDDAAIAGTFARAVVDQLRLQGSAAGSDVNGIARARQALTRAAQLDPEDAYITAMRGYVEYADGSGLEKARALLEQAVGQSPAREEYQLLLAQVLIEESERRDGSTHETLRDVSGPSTEPVTRSAALDPLAAARAMLERLLVRGSRPDVRGAARRMLARVDAGSTPDAAGASDPRDAASAAAATVPAVPSTTSPSGASPAEVEVRSGDRTIMANPASIVGVDGPRYRLLLRPVGSGEARAAGDLVRIDCGGAPIGSIVVQVRTADATLRLRARGFEQVAFVNFRPDPLPPPRCGAIDPSLHVLATYRPTGPGDGEVVAIEIVPAEYVPR